MIKRIFWEHPGMVNWRFTKPEALPEQEELDELLLLLLDEEPQDMADMDDEHEEEEELELEDPHDEDLE